MAKADLVEVVWNQELAYVGCLKSGDVDGYLALLHDSFSGWPSGMPAPIDKERGRQILAGAVDAIQPGKANIELERASVQVFGAMAIVLGKIHTRVSLKNGQDVESQERFTHTWLLTDGGWKIIGGMSAPLSAG